MGRSLCARCGKWGKDRCICPSKKSTIKQPKKEQPHNPKPTTTADDRRLELQVELAKMQLLQARLEAEKKQKRIEKKQKKAEEERKSKERWHGYSRWYGKSSWYRHKNNRWRHNRQNPQNDDDFDLDVEEWLSACNDGMN